jgi:dynein heavy chain
MTELQFQPDKTITGMYSGEKEFIPFVGTLDPKDKKVEDWMGEVENMMFSTVREVLHYSIKDYLELDRNAWIKKHCGQCVLNGSQVHWTTEVEQAMIKNGDKGAEEILKALDV